MNSASALALDPYQITRLLHLSSPALPIGGFSYSQGLEAAVELQLIHDEPTALHWIEQQLQRVIARTEAPLWCLMYQAWQAQDWPALDEWNQWFLRHANPKSYAKKPSKWAYPCINSCRRLIGVRPQQ